MDCNSSTKIYSLSMYFKNIKFFCFLILSISLSSCTTIKISDKDYYSVNKEYYIPNNFLWENIYNGIDYYSFSHKRPNLKYHLVRINLDKANMRIKIYPEESDFIQKKGKKTNIFMGRLVTQYAKKNKYQIAINLSPFEYTSIFKRQNVGVLVNNKKELFQKIKKYAYLGINEINGKYYAEILRNQNNENKKFDYELGGFFTVIENGKKMDFPYYSQDGRTAVGISKDERTLYVLIVEKNLFSKGLSYQECNEILLATKVYNAIQFDGGGSTSLYIEKNKINVGLRPVASSLYISVYDKEN